MCHRHVSVITNVAVGYVQVTVKGEFGEVQILIGEILKLASGIS